MALERHCKLQSNLAVGWYELGTFYKSKKPLFRGDFYSVVSGFHRKTDTVNKIFIVHTRAAFVEDKLYGQAYVDSLPMY